MKNAMNDHVDRERHRMFKEATSTVQKHLNVMCRTLMEKMENKADEIFISMRHDYMTVLGGVKADQTAIVSKDERALRTDIKTLLQGVDEQFRRIVHGDVEEPLNEETKQDNVDDGESSKTRVLEDDDDVESHLESRMESTEPAIDGLPKTESAAGSEAMNDSISARNTPAEEANMDDVEGPPDASSMSVASNDVAMSGADQESVASNDVDMDGDDDDEL
jgi:hypothetical protein